MMFRKDSKNLRANGFFLPELEVCEAIFCWGELDGRIAWIGLLALRGF
jgi:hypothetical protein